MKPTIEELKKYLLEAADVSQSENKEPAYTLVYNAITELGELRTWKEESIKSLIGYGETTAAVLTLQAKLGKESR